MNKELIITDEERKLIIESLVLLKKISIDDVSYLYDCWKFKPQTQLSRHRNEYEKDYKTKVEKIEKTITLLKKLKIK